jgi:beta-N-acetylhexosaminidase
MRGQHSQGVASCLKHWPGIGIGSADPHYGATVIDIAHDELLRRDLVPFARLGSEARAIMIGHGTYPQIDDPDLPASLSRRLTADLLREIGFDGLAVSDDMEMHAVSDLGTYEVIAERALKAGNDIILFCSHIERIPDIQKFLRARVNEERSIAERFADAVRRADRYREHCHDLRRRADPPAPNFQALLDEAARFCDAFEKTRPAREAGAPDVDRRQGPRTPGKGRTGREEWT